MPRMFLLLMTHRAMVQEKIPSTLRAKSDTATSRQIPLSRRDDDPFQSLQFARLQSVDEIRKRINQLSAHGAAEATIGKLDNAVAGFLDK